MDSPFLVFAAPFVPTAAAGGPLGGMSLCEDLSSAPADDQKPCSVAAPAGSTVSATSTARMKAYGSTTVAQQTRHARRIYCGGIPPNFTDEDGLRNFINAIMAQGLREENDHSYVLSVYINHKKCFAFVELKSIELASAALLLDGIIFRNIVLRILRANEYKPELVPPHLHKDIPFDVTGFQFGTPHAHASPSDVDGEAAPRGELYTTIDSSGAFLLDPGNICLLGYPLDDGMRHAGNRGIGCSAAARCLRQLLRKGRFGSLDNPEFDVDFSGVKVFDVGDVSMGNCAEEAKANAAAAVADLVLRRTVPVVIGGPSDCALHSTAGLMDSCMSKVAAVYISAQLDVRLLQDPRWGPDCPIVYFAAQGAQCSSVDAQLVAARGGHIVWLQRDLRDPVRGCVSEQFSDVLKQLTQTHDGEFVSIVVTLDAGALSSELTPTANSTQSPAGLHLEESRDIARQCGASPNVSLLNLTEYSPQSEDFRHNLVLAELFYQFAVGVALRPARLQGPRLTSLPAGLVGLVEPADEKGISEARRGSSGTYDSASARNSRSEQGLSTSSRTSSEARTPPGSARLGQLQGLIGEGATRARFFRSSAADENYFGIIE